MPVTSLGVRARERFNPMSPLDYLLSVIRDSQNELHVRLHAAVRFVQCATFALGPITSYLAGQYNQSVRVLALNVEEGWVRDVSEVIAAKVRDVARRDGQGLTGGTRDFVEAHSDPADEQQVPPLFQRSAGPLRCRCWQRC